MREEPGACLFNVCKWCNDNYENRRRKDVCEVHYNIPVF
jgi:hypothetical protein